MTYLAGKPSYTYSILMVWTAIYILEYHNTEQRQVFRCIRLLRCHYKLKCILYNLSVGYTLKNVCQGQFVYIFNIHNFFSSVGSRLQYNISLNIIVTRGFLHIQQKNKSIYFQPDHPPYQRQSPRELPVYLCQVSPCVDILKKIFT